MEHTFMSGRKQFWIVIIFAIVSAAPFVTVALSLNKLRNSVILDKPVDWKEGAEYTFGHEAVSPGEYEIRLDSDVSDWQPTVKLSWVYSKMSPEAKSATGPSGEITISSNSSEVALTRPIDKIHIEKDWDAHYVLKVKFLSTNPDKHAVRLKIGRDREALLAQSTHDFIYSLAISLVLLALLWKPLMSIPSEREKPQGSPGPV